MVQTRKILAQYLKYNNIKYIKIYNIKMEKKSELIKIRIENHTCYYFNHIIKFEDFDFDVLLGEKS